MEMETPLPLEAAQPSFPDVGGARTDGLAAAIAGEIGAATGAPGADSGAERRKGGRPPVHGAYSKANGSDGKHPAPQQIAVEFPPEGDGGNVETGGETRVSLPPDLFSKILQEGLTAAEAYVGSRIEGQALRAGLSREDIAPQLEQTKLGDRRRAIVAELVPLALAEHGLDPEMSPTTALGLILVPWGFGAYTAFAELGKLAAEKAAREARERKADV